MVMQKFLGRQQVLDVSSIDLLIAVDLVDNNPELKRTLGAEGILQRAQVVLAALYKEGMGQYGIGIPIGVEGMTIYDKARGLEKLGFRTPKDLGGRGRRR